MRYFSFVLFSVLLFLVISCASTTKTGQSTEKRLMLSNNEKLTNLEFNANFYTKSNTGNELNFNAVVNIANTDSLSMNVYGPFGILVGKLFADNNNFKFHNIFENTYYTGSPSADNIARATGIYLSIKDFIHFIRTELPYNPSEFSEKNQSNLDENKKLFIRIDERNFADLALYDSNQFLKEYQRKDENNTTVMRIIFDNYKNFEDIRIANKLNAEFPKNNVGLSYEINSLKINKDAAKPQNFKIPQTAKVVDLNSVN